MTYVRVVFAATLVGALGMGSSLLAQDPQPKVPELKSVLAGRKFTPPIRGQADVDFVKGQTRRVGQTLVTQIRVQNMSNAPIPRLTIDETWYDKNNNLIPGGKGVINGLLQPGEVADLEIRTPIDPRMNTSTLMFSHANGTVKPRAVRKIDEPKKEDEAEK